MYDKITGKLFYNQGTGQFQYAELPYSTKLSYLESTGTQYVDTGLVMSGADFSIDWEVDTTDITTDRTMFGAQHLDPDGTASDWIWSGQLYCSAEEKYTLLVGKNYQFNISIEAGRHVCNLFLANGTATLLVDGVQKAQISNVVYPAQVHSTTLFANNFGGRPQQKPAMRLYRWKLTENGSAARDLIPVLDKSGVPCMYDRVTNRLFYNAGTGTFNYA